jgi:hypothetical protein
MLMLRTIVRCAVAALVFGTIACSDTTNPTGDLTHRTSRLAAAAAIPFLPNVHTAAIPALDNPDFDLKGFNDFGEIVGDSASFTTYKWQGSRGLTTLHLPGAISNAWGVNDQGTVAITVNGNGGPPVFSTVGTWDWFGNVRLLRALSPNASCVAWGGINNAGVVAGACGGAGIPGLATLWTKFGNPDALHVGGGTTLVLGQAMAISDSGFVAVANTLDPLDLATGSVFTPAKAVLPLSPAERAFPAAVNDSGWVAGAVFDTTIEQKVAAVWTRNDSLHVLGIGQMHAISREGIAVGQVMDSTVLRIVPVIWTPANGLQRLPGLEGGAALAKESGNAMFINTHHQIIGTITLSDGATQRKVMWTLPF